MEFGNDGKIAKKIQDKIKTIAPGVAIFLVSYDDEAEK